MTAATQGESPLQSKKRRQKLGPVVRGANIRPTADEVFGLKANILNRTVSAPPTILDCKPDAGRVVDDPASLGSSNKQRLFLRPYQRCTSYYHLQQSPEGASGSKRIAMVNGDNVWSGHNYAPQTRRLARKAHSHERADHGHVQTRKVAENGSNHVKATAEGKHGFVDPFVWDGENSWEWDFPRTLYFEPVAGLGNRLRALASAVVMAKEFGVGLKVIWRFEAGCENCGNPGFNSSWPDLFSEPKLRLADNFPGSNYSAMEELAFLRAKGRDEHTPPLQPGQCYLHYPHSHHEMKEIMTNSWQSVGGKEVLCIKSDLWLTEAGEKEGKFFFRLLKPSAMVQNMINTFKYETEWEENHMVGVHVRRGDLTIYGKNDHHSKITQLIPIESYIEAMRKQKELAIGVKRVRFFLATDDAAAEAEIKAAFKPGTFLISNLDEASVKAVAGYVMTYKKSQWSRLAVEGIQEALLDVMLLADCPVLIGTYYSSYSETAKMMGWPFYIQIGHALKKLSVETVIEKDDPEEDALQRRRRRLLESDI